MKYIDVEKLIAEIDRWKNKAKEKYNKSTYSMGRCDALAEFRNYIVSLQQKPPEDTDVLRAKLINFLTRNNIQEDKAKYLADRISDTYGAQRYLDGLCDGMDGEDIQRKEQPEVDLDAVIEMEWNLFNKQLKQYGKEPEEVVLLNWFRFYNVARHFYELGSNTRKEEE